MSTTSRDRRAADIGLVAGYLRELRRKPAPGTSDTATARPGRPRAAPAPQAAATGSTHGATPRSGTPVRAV